MTRADILAAINWALRHDWLLAGSGIAAGLIVTLIERALP